MSCWIGIRGERNCCCETPSIPCRNTSLCPGSCAWRPHQGTSHLALTEPNATAFATEQQRQREQVGRNRFSELQYAAHVRDLRRKTPNDDFHIVLQRPFVVVGDEPLAVVKRRAEQTVRWAVDHLKREYFSNDPEVILDIWLFRDKTSYEANTASLFGAKPTTPFGYYSRANRALVMNIATGGGTLVHEIVHPFIEANFPSCPSWFNEGLASLYEQSAERDGRIVGLTNWRLKGLQKAIQDGSVSSFEALCATSRAEFYGNRGTNYAQARYLCYYLQEDGRLRDFYHQFVRDADQDPTGLTTLKSTLRPQDLATFQREWEAFVSRLTFP